MPRTKRGRLNRNRPRRNRSPHPRGYRGWGDPNAGVLKTLLRVLWDFVGLPIAFSFMAYAIVGLIFTAARSRDDSDWYGLIFLLMALTMHLSRTTFARAALVAPQGEYFQQEDEAGEETQNTSFARRSRNWWLKHLSHDVPLLVHIPCRIISRALVIQLFIEASDDFFAGSGSGAVLPASYRFSAEQELVFLAINTCLASVSTFALARALRNLHIWIDGYRVRQRTTFRQHPQLPSQRDLRALATPRAVSNLLGYTIALVPGCIALGYVSPATIIPYLTRQGAPYIAAVMAAELVNSTLIFAGLQFGRPIALLIREGGKGTRFIYHAMRRSWLRSQNLPDPRRHIENARLRQLTNQLNQSQISIEMEEVHPSPPARRITQETRLGRSESTQQLLLNMTPSPSMASLANNGSLTFFQPGQNSVYVPSTGSSGNSSQTTLAHPQSDSSLIIHNGVYLIRQSSDPQANTTATPTDIPEGATFTVGPGGSSSSGSSSKSGSNDSIDSGDEQEASEQNKTPMEFICQNRMEHTVSYPSPPSGVFTVPPTPLGNNGQLFSFLQRQRALSKISEEPHSNQSHGDSVNSPPSHLNSITSEDNLCLGLARAQIDQLLGSLDPSEELEDNVFTD